ncbi:oxidoreductase, short-chain dehydrogenase/reductase family [hydrothermal vent metagenome]|uniref:Oxidoreductase, short-chain dehydrogenase/reductase family n=1 Tax=hydrothermal vent metagenome TaxID=652676 RepID=A0A3B0RUS8_9ZZZZ
MPYPLSMPSKIMLTGGTSGIGAEMLTMLLAAGHEVIVVARRASELEPQAGMHPYDCDLADAQAVTAMMASVSQTHEDITVLINNAALQYAVPLTAEEFDPVMMDAEVMINLIAPALITHALLPGLRQHGGRAAVVNISSGLAFFPKQQTALYCATKAAIHSFSQSLRYQLEEDGVGVIEAILPLVDTPMTHGRGSGKISASAAAKAILDGIGRGQPEIYIGKAKLIPYLTRLMPSLGRKILRGS